MMKFRHVFHVIGAVRILTFTAAHQPVFTGLTCLRRARSPSRFQTPVPASDLLPAVNQARGKFWRQLRHNDIAVTLVQQVNGTHLIEVIFNIRQWRKLINAPLSQALN
ncbi:hypothetical protein [Enterobacter sp.]|uniref:hypothetical protein n=1 Tax=Enterobacter sp. TaxID=42895 RepID=UPI00296FC588|nr:hypothetical protein [Enterobacter sp.]